MSLDRQQAKALRTLADGAKAGHYTLPPALPPAALWAAVLQVHEWQATADRTGTLHGPDAVEAQAQLLGTTTRPGEKAPAAIAAGVDALVAAEREYERQHLRVLLLAAASDAAELHYLTVAQRALPAVVVEHLQPAFAATLAAARAALAGLGRLAPTRDAMFGQPPKVVAAYQALEAAATRYQALRTAQGAVQLLGYRPRSTMAEDSDGMRRQQADVDGDCAAAQDGFDNVWADRGGLGGFQPVPAPWPADPVGALAWQVGHGALLWLPTVPEQDAAYRARAARQRGEFQAASAQAQRRGGAARPKPATPPRVPAAGA